MRLASVKQQCRPRKNPRRREPESHGNRIAISEIADRGAIGSPTITAARIRRCIAAADDKLIAALRRSTSTIAIAAFDAARTLTMRMQSRVPNSAGESAWKLVTRSSAHNEESDDAR